MFTLFVKFTIDPQKRETLLQALREDGQASLDTEPGTICFDVIEDASNPNVLFLYEAYQDEQAFINHTQGEPYRKFMTILQDLLAHQYCQAEEIMRGNRLFPASDD